MYAKDFHQPDFYHFSQTAIEAASWIAHNLSLKHHPLLSLRDYFAGCGVLSLEIAARLPSETRIDLTCIELQQDFSPCLNKNVQSYSQMRPNLRTQVVMSDALSFHETIVSQEPASVYNVLNPPHYFSNEGKPSDDSRRQSCLFIDESYWMDVLFGFKARTYILLNRETKMYEVTKKILNKHIKIIQPLSGREVLVVT